MKIAMLSMKGGVGKTTLSYALAQHSRIDANIITNDKYNFLLELFPEDVMLVDNLDIDLSQFKDVIFDFGGFLDNKILNILEQVDLIIVPTFEDLLSLKVAVDTIAEIENISKRIIVVHNKASKSETVQNAIEEYFDNIDVVKVHNSKLYDNAMNETESPEAFATKTELNKYIYRNALNDLDNLIDLIKGGN